MSAKVRDEKNRWRSKSVGFHVSPEEWEHFGKIVAISGLNKQDYLISRLYDRDIVVQGNPRVYKALRNQLKEVHETLKQLQAQQGSGALDDELADLIRQINKTLYGLQNEQEKSPYPAR